MTNDGLAAVLGITPVRHERMRAPGRPSGGQGAISAGHAYRGGQFMAHPLKGSPPPAKPEDPRVARLRQLFAGKLRPDPRPQNA